MTAPDVVMVGMAESELPRECVALFADNCAVTVLGFQQHRGLAHLYQVRPQRLELGEVAPQELVRHIRSAVRQPSELTTWRAIPQSQR